MLAHTHIFERRGMAVPSAMPTGLTDEFALDATRQSLWQAFLKKNELPPEPLLSIVHRLRSALAPALNQAGHGVARIVQLAQRTGLGSQCAGHFPLGGQPRCGLQAGRVGADAVLDQPPLAQTAGVLAGGQPRLAAVRVEW